jgi:DNA-binding NtrC family response regulator
MTVTSAAPKVLVIDDEPVIAETLAIVFSGAGYETRSVKSSEAALALLETRWIPQFVLIDVHLPGMNGIDLAISLKAQYPEMTFSLFSGRPETADLMEEAKKQGHYFNLLAKPVHPTVLLGVASSILGNAEGESTPRPQYPS